MNNIVELFEPLLAKTTDGIKIRKWGYQSFSLGYWDDTVTWTDASLWVEGPQSVVECDVQPRSLNEYELKQWGINPQTPDAKLVYYLDFDSYFAMNNRARVDGTSIYEIKGVNLWPGHTEAVFIPVIGE